MTLDDGVRLWWLIREAGPDSSYVLTAYVRTDRDEKSESPAFESTIVGLQNRLAALGETAAEAEKNAMLLLRDMLEDAIESDEVEACFRDAKGLGWKLTLVPFNEMAATIQEFVANTSEPSKSKLVIEDEDGSGWRATPATAEVCA